MRTVRMEVSSGSRWAVDFSQLGSLHSQLGSLHSERQYRGQTRQLTCQYRVDTHLLGWRRGTNPAVLGVLELWDEVLVMAGVGRRIRLPSDMT